MTTEAQKRAIERYRRTKKGKEAQAEAQRRYAESEKGKEAQAEAQERYRENNAEALREYKRLKAREYRAKQKAKKAMAQPDDRGDGL